jgi:hypothetical protein
MKVYIIECAANKDMGMKHKPVYTLIYVLVRVRGAIIKNRKSVKEKCKCGNVMMKTPYMYNLICINKNTKISVCQRKLMEKSINKYTILAKRKMLRQNSKVFHMYSVRSTKIIWFSRQVPTWIGVSYLTVNLVNVEEVTAKHTMKTRCIQTLPAQYSAAKSQHHTHSCCLGTEILR